MAIGFAAQLVDGALGMAYGQISSTLLIAKGVPGEAQMVAAAIHQQAVTNAIGTRRVEIVFASTVMP